MGDSRLCSTKQRSGARFAGPGWPRSGVLNTRKQSTEKNSHKLKDRLFFNVTLLTALVLVLEKMAPSTADVEGEAEGSRVIER